MTHTQTENRGKYDRLRVTSWITQPKNKPLSAREVRAIRQLAAEGTSRRQIARAFGKAHSVVSSILGGLTHRGVE